jgi:plastocyanin
VPARLCVLLLTVVSGCASRASATPAASTSAPVPAALSILNGIYSTATVRAGVQFVIANGDAWAHTVTDVGGGFNVRLEGDTTAMLTISKPGVYQVYCNLHGAMRGAITVISG